MYYGRRQWGNALVQALSVIVRTQAQPTEIIIQEVIQLLEKMATHTKVRIQFHLSDMVNIHSDTYHLSEPRVKTDSRDTSSGGACVGKTRT